MARTKKTKLTPVQVMSIYLDERPQKEIAAEYGVSAGCICDIKRGRSWQQVTGKVWMPDGPLYVRATHWMPLPDPPREIAGVPMSKRAYMALRHGVGVSENE